MPRIRPAIPCAFADNVAGRGLIGDAVDATPLSDDPPRVRWIDRIVGAALPRRDYRPQSERAQGYVLLAPVPPR